MLGAGVMATALTFPAVENGNEVRFIGTHLDDDIIDSIQATRQHPVLELKVDERAKAYHFANAAEAIEGADVIMSGVNSFGVDWVGRQLAKLGRVSYIWSHWRMACRTVADL
ncbi:glycerol-3-phosphate dehydrogenase (NAD(P)+) [Cutibacterium acnes C1]|nr:glycerol-3-phosphate dehydrogenase (NAD(P)+) [Cutibacterium acnes C1]